MNRVTTRVEWSSVVRYLRDPRSDWKPKTLLVVAILYLIWPIDLVPDLIPLLGWLDDIGFGLFAAWVVVRAVRSYHPPQS